MKYAPPLGSAGPDAGYSDPVEGTVPAAAVEQPMREIASVIQAVGLVPSETDLTQLDQAIDMKVAAMQPDLSAFVGTERMIAATAPLTGGGSLAADVTLGIRASCTAAPEHVVLRDSAGRAQTADPTAQADIATKGYTDGALSELEASVKAYVDTVTSIDFSEQEQWTGRRWIDGKKIYQKTIVCGRLPDTAVKDVEHAIEHIENIVSHDAYAFTEANYAAWLSLPYASYDSTAVINIVFTKEHIRIGTSMNRENFSSCHVTLQYTCTDR